MYGFWTFVSISVWLLVVGLVLVWGYGSCR
jgi:hypothetical protein